MYTTVEALILTTPSVNSVSNITSAALAHYINRADSVIDAKLASRYTVPLSPIPEIIKTISTDLAIYEIVGKRMVTLVKDVENDWPSRFKEANDLLDKIATGEFTLVASGGTILSTLTTNLVWSNTQNYTPTFNEDELTESYLDYDKYEDIVDARD